MKPAERLEKLIRERRYKAGAETYDKALGSFLLAVDEHIKQKSVQTRPKIWRKIVDSRITKLAAAAVIIVVAYVFIHQSGGSIDVATTTFAQITENMKKMPWMHAVVEAAGDRLEVWFCFERRIMAQIPPDGWVTYQDDLKQTIHKYSPDTNTITVSQSTSDALAAMGDSALDFPNSVIKHFEAAGEKVIQESGKYNGIDVKIYKMSAFLSGMDMKIEMIVDAEKNILLFVNQKARKAGESLEAKGYFDYPEKGPESIYDLGVPRSAKVSGLTKEKSPYRKAIDEALARVDSRKSWPEPRDVVIAYWKARNAKNYDETSTLWPGSATWNRQIIEKEEPVEYVFDEVQAGEIEGHIIVPYASKSHFDKHGKYGLKMVLSNEKSTKGRYYIISGN
jgi:hypothetical protein